MQPFQRLTGKRTRWENVTAARGGGLREVAEGEPLATDHARASIPRELATLAFVSFFGANIG